MRKILLTAQEYLGLQFSYPGSMDLRVCQKNKPRSLQKLPPSPQVNSKGQIPRDGGSLKMWNHQTPSFLMKMRWTHVVTVVYLAWYGRCSGTVLRFQMWSFGWNVLQRLLFASFCISHLSMVEDCWRHPKDKVGNDTGTIPTSIVIWMMKMIGIWRLDSAKYRQRNAAGNVTISAVMVGPLVILCWQPHDWSCLSLLLEMWLKFSMQIFVHLLPVILSRQYTYLYTHSWETMKSVLSNGNWSLSFMTKVMVWFFVGDTDKVMTTFILVVFVLGWPE